MRDPYTRFIKCQNIEGSNKATSYIRALDLLDSILKRFELFGCHDFWSIDSPETISRLYEYALQNQKVTGSEFLDPALPPSYGTNGYYSAALSSYLEFLILYQHKNQLWKLYNQPEMSAEELSQRLQTKRIKSAASLLMKSDLDIASKEGKEVLRTIKARVNQDFFRDMILSEYRTQCCITGLNVPEVLRASHIIAWKDDVKNRLNPSNGLCLSATYDAAFDRHLISFDEDYRLILSPSLKDYHTNNAFKTQFKAFEGQQILLPTRFLPSQTFMSNHRERMPK